MAIQFDDNIPIYIQLMDGFKKMIVRGTLKPGEQMKSVRDYALEFGVNPNTIQKALQELEKEGLMKSERTTGRFVQANQDQIHEIQETMAKEQTSRFLKQMQELGFDQEQAIQLVQTFRKEQES